jgi:hypothetical protein
MISLSCLGHRPSSRSSWTATTTTQDRWRADLVDDRHADISCPPPWRTPVRQPGLFCPPTWSIRRPLSHRQPDHLHLRGPPDRREPSYRWSHDSRGRTRAQGQRQRHVDNRKPLPHKALLDRATRNADSGRLVVTSRFCPRDADPLDLGVRDAELLEVHRPVIDDRPPLDGGAGLQIPAGSSPSSDQSANEREEGDHP